MLRPEERAPDAYLNGGQQALQQTQIALQQAQQAASNITLGSAATAVDSVAVKVPWFVWLAVGAYAGWWAAGRWSGKGSGSGKKD